MHQEGIIKYALIVLDGELNLPVEEIDKRTIHQSKRRNETMNEERAIEILKDRKEYYNMHHVGYDEVIKWLEGRKRRNKKKRGKLKQEK